MTKLTTTAAAADITADAKSRTITGIVLPYNTSGRTSVGPVTVPPGVLALPAELKRIKLYRDHSDVGGTPVGYATAALSNDGRLTMSFQVGHGVDGDQALADAAGGVRDALSVELLDVKLSPNRTVTAGRLSAVALVALPAFDDARVLDVTAAATDTEEEDDDMPNEQDPTVTPPATEQAPTEQPATAQPTPAPQPAPAEQAPAPALTAAAAPGGLATTTAPRPLNFSQVCEKLQAVRSGQQPLTAALADITRSANPWVSPDGWVGELWDGVNYQREIVPLLSRKSLTHWSITGWRWTTKPVVADYTGDKTEVPSNVVATETVTVEASRLAGAHDIDRKFWDFNDREFLQSYYQALAESYAFESDSRAAQFVEANARVALESDGTTPASSDTLLGAVALGAQHVKLGSRARATFAMVNPTDYMDLIKLTELDLPAFLTTLGFAPGALTVSEFVTQGTVIVGTKSAASFYELAGSPIRVEAVDIANGGRDAGVFGYYATLLHSDTGIVSVEYTPAP